MAILCSVNLNSPNMIPSGRHRYEQFLTWAHVPSKRQFNTAPGISLRLTRLCAHLTFQWALCPAKARLGIEFQAQNPKVSKDFQSVLGRQASNNRKLKNKTQNSNYYSKMISEDSLPTKSRSLRAKSIAKRLATEKNQSDVKQGGRKSSSNFKASAKRSSSSSSKHHTMSKYRRKVANAKGQLILKFLFGVIVLTKIATKIL